MDVVDHKAMNAACSVMETARRTTQSSHFTAHGVRWPSGCRRYFLGIDADYSPLGLSGFVRALRMSQ
jgi:hypothetical protein